MEKGNGNGNKVNHSFNLVLFDEESIDIKRVLTSSGITENSNFLLFNHDKAIQNLIDPDAIFTICDYKCSIKKCRSKFHLLNRWGDVPIILFKPLRARRPISLNNAFLFSIFTNGKREFEMKKWFCKVLNSRLHACSLSWNIHPTDPFFKIAMAQRIIQENVEFPIVLSKAMEKIGWSYPWLSTKFVEYTGVTLDECMLTQKMCHTLWKIISSTALIKSIAYEFGYKDPLYFSKIFKKRFGTSPTLIRKFIGNFY